MSATYSHAFDHIPGEDDSEYAYTDFEVQIQRPLAFLRVKQIKDAQNCHSEC